MSAVFHLSLKIDHFQETDTTEIKANFNLHVKFQTFHKHTSKTSGLTFGITFFGGGCMFYYFSPNKSLSVTEKGDLARLALLTGMQRNLDTCAHAHAHEYCHRKICKL